MKTLPLELLQPRPDPDTSSPGAVGAWNGHLVAPWQSPDLRNADAVDGPERMAQGLGAGGRHVSVGDGQPAVAAGAPSAPTTRAS